MKVFRWIVTASLMVWMGAATATPQSALQVEQTLSKASVNVRACQGNPDQSVATVRLTSAESVKPLDLILVLDGSLSESVPDVQDAGRRLLGHLNPQRGDRVAVVGFSDAARLSQGLVGDFVAVTAAIDQLNTGRRTALGDALGLALDTLNQGKRAEALPAVVVFSDGGATVGLDPQAQADKAKGLGLPIYFVGVSDSVNRALLSELARRAAGSFFASASDQSLLGVLKRLERTLQAEFITIRQTLPDVLSYAGTPIGMLAPKMTRSLSGTTDLVWEVSTLVSGQVWQTQFFVVAEQVGAFSLNRASELSYLNAQGVRVREPLPNPPLQATGTAPPLALFDLVPAQPKTNQIVQFFDRSTSQGSTIASWHWDFGDGASSSEQNPTHNYAELGSYTVRLTVTDAANCAVTTSTTFRISEVVPGPAPELPPPPDGMGGTTGEGQRDVTIEIGTQTLRTGAAAPFTLGGQDAGTVKACQWNFGDQTSSDQCNATHTYTQAGTYTIVLKATFEGGATASFRREVSVLRENIAPVAGFSFSPPLQRVGRPVGFDSNASGDSDGSVAGWRWDFGDGTTSTQANPIHEFARPGLFKVTLIVTDNEGLASAPLTQEVRVGLPRAAFGDVGGLQGQGPVVPEWMTFYIDGGVVTDEELEDAARRFANGSFVQSTQYRLTENDLRAITDLHDLRVVTAKYREPAAAEADGYARVGAPAPGRGVNYVNEDLLNADAPPKFDRVPVLIYAPNEDGKLVLAGVRFVAFDEASAKLFGLTGWSTLKPPRPPGVPVPPADAPLGVPDTIYVLTVWIWRENPNGMFAPLNPQIP